MLKKIIIFLLIILPVFSMLTFFAGFKILPWFGLVLTVVNTGAIMRELGYILNIWRSRHSFTLLFKLERWNDGNQWRLYFLFWEFNWDREYQHEFTEQEKKEWEDALYKAKKEAWDIFSQYEEFQGIGIGAAGDPHLKIFWKEKPKFFDILCKTHNYIELRHEVTGEVVLF